MILDFTSLVIKNFGSFLGEHELDLASFGPGLHFVKGDNREEPALEANGVGKTTIWNALCWCLYGRTPDGRRNPDIQPRFGDKHTTVTISLLLDTKPRTVIRTTHPNRLLLDNSEVGQEQIDDLLQQSFEVFTHTELLGQGRPLFFDLKPEAKMSLLGSVLNLDRWDARSEIASEATKALALKEATLTGELDAIETNRTQLTALLETAKRNWREWRDEQDALTKSAEHTLAELKEKHEVVERKKAGFSLAYDSAATELKAAQAATRKLAEAGEKLILDRSPLTGEVATHKEKARSLRAELEVLGEADECPTCGQSLKGTGLDKHKAELTVQLTAVSKKLKKAEQAQNELIAQWNELQPRLVRSRTDEKTFQDKVAVQRDELGRIAPELAELNAQIKQLETNRKVIGANPYTDQVTEFRHNIKQLDTDYKEKYAKLQKLSEQTERTKFWIKGFKDVRLYIIDDLLQELELTTNAALPEIGLIDWQITYSIEKETKSGTIQRGLNVMIQSPKDKAPVKWECWSGGEGQRLRLVGALALSEVLLARAGVEASMEILDEPSRGLSSRGITDLCEFLADRAQTLKRMIWLTDHQSVESSRFTSVLTVVKTKEGSELVI